MKKLLFSLVLGLGCSLGFANGHNSDPSITNNKEEETVNCTWCVVSGEDTYCAEASSCSDARKTARELAMADQLDNITIDGEPVGSPLD